MILSKESQQDTGSYGRADHSGYVRSHGVHEQVVARVAFETYGL